MMSSFVLQGKTAMSYSLGLKYMLDFGLLNFFIFGVTEQAVPSTHDRIEHLDGLLQSQLHAPSGVPHSLHRSWRPDLWSRMVS